jgi:hypothetical protein
MANANLVLIDSLVAQRSDGSVIIGRGVPGGWLRPRQVIEVANVPLGHARHLGLRITGGHRAVRLRLTGSRTGPVLFQLPAFVRNIARVSGGQISEASGTVTLSRSVRAVTVWLKHAPRG